MPVIDITAESIVVKYVHTTQYWLGFMTMGMTHWLHDTPIEELRTARYIVDNYNFYEVFRMSNTAKIEKLIQLIDSIYRIKHPRSYFDSDDIYWMKQDGGEYIMYTDTLISYMIITEKELQTSLSNFQ